MFLLFDGGFFRFHVRFRGGRVLYRKTIKQACKEGMQFGHFESPGMCVFGWFWYTYIYIYIHAMAKKRLTTDGLVEAALTTEIVKQRHCSHVCWGLKSRYFLMIGDGHQHNSVPIIRIPYQRWDEGYPQYREFFLDPGTWSCMTPQMNLSEPLLFLLEVRRLETIGG